jgi:hypothetical protein
MIAELFAWTCGRSFALLANDPAGKEQMVTVMAIT